MSSPAVTPRISTQTDAAKSGLSRVDAAELRSDAQILGASGVAAAVMIAAAHAELAAAVTTVVTAVATVPMWLRSRKLER